MSKSPALRSRLSEASQHRRGGKRNLGKAPEPIRANKMASGCSYEHLEVQVLPQLEHQPTNFPSSHAHHRLHPSNMGDEPRKRSRFDQEEPVRRSKFDRRSRSPPHGDSEARATRSRSPVVKEGSGPKRDAAAAAAEAAARINAQLSQKKAPQHVDVPPIRAVWPRDRSKKLPQTAMLTLPPRPTLPASCRALQSPPPLRPIVVLSMLRSTSKTVTTSKTSRSTTCVIATP